MPSPISIEAIFALDQKLADIVSTTQADTDMTPIDVDLVRLCEIHRQLLARHSAPSPESNALVTLFEAASILREVADDLERVANPT